MQIYSMRTMSMSPFNHFVWILLRNPSHTRWKVHTMCQNAVLHTLWIIMWLLPFTIWCNSSKIMLRWDPSSPRDSIQCLYTNLQRNVPCGSEIDDRGSPDKQLRGLWCSIDWNSSDINPCKIWTPNSKYWESFRTSSCLSYSNPLHIDPARCMRKDWWFTHSTSLEISIVLNHAS